MILKSCEIGLYFYLSSLKGFKKMLQIIEK